MPFPGHTFTTVVGLGLTHLFDDIPSLVEALGAQAAPDGRLYLSGLVAATRRGSCYLEILRRAGETATPRTADELRNALGQVEAFSTIGCMAYAILSVRWRTHFTARGRQDVVPGRHPFG